MASVQVTTLPGATALLDDEAIDAFRAGLRGPLLRPATPATTRRAASATA